MLDVSPGELYYMHATGKLAFTRIGGDLFYDREDIAKIFEQNKTGP